MPRHTSHYGWEASRPTREPSRQFVYAQACVNRRTRHGATAFRRDPGEIPPTAYAPAYVVHQTEDIPHHPETAIPTCVCPRIRHTTDTRRSTPAWDRNAGLRMPRHTQTAEHGTARPLSGEIRPTAYAPAYRMRRKPEQQSKLPPDTHAPKKTQRGGSPHVQGFRLFGRPASTGLSLPIQAFTPIPAGTGAYLRAPVCQIRSR